MSKLIVAKENIIEPTVDNLKKLLHDGEYILCGDLKDKNNPESIVLGNVFCIKNNALVSFCISNKPGDNKFKLHDDVVIGGKMQDLVIHTMIETYDLFIKDFHNVDRKHIYGKLGTPHENKIVFEY